MTTRIGNPFALFVERNSLPITGGDCYIGADGMDPELNPVSVYADEAMTVEVPQPIKIIGGHLCNDGNPALIYIATDVYSIRVYGSAGNEVFYASHAVTAATAYQPLDADLTAISALGTTAFGRALLTQTDAPTARDYLGVTELTTVPFEMLVAVSDESTALTTGTNKVTFRTPCAFTLTAVRASLVTAQTSGSIFTVDVNEAGASVLSTKLTIDNGEKTSVTAGAQPVISDASIADDAEITIDIDQVGDGTAKGLKVTLIGTRAL